MPTNFFHDKEADRVGVAREDRVVSQIELKLKQNACAAISCYFDCLRSKQILGSVPLDRLTGSVTELSACTNYLHYEDSAGVLYYERRKMLLRFVSMKIKEYIDSKE